MPVTEAHETTPRQGPHYPQSEEHRWGCFAGLAIEFDGYCNVEVIAPWTGKVLFVPDVFSREPGAEIEAWPTILRRVADAIEAAGWTGE